jgi:FAD/FMN-containing dehydrogenase
LKTSFVAAETDARSMALQQSVKQVFDPAGRMNPGKGLAATPSSFAG